MKTILSFFSLPILSIALWSCEQGNNVEPNVEIEPDTEFKYLKSTRINTGYWKDVWLDIGNYGINFFDFYSENQAQAVDYGRYFERFSKFDYQISDDLISINYHSDDIYTNGEINHSYNRRGDTLIIGGLTLSPQNPDLFFVRKDVMNSYSNDTTITFGYNQLFYSNPGDYRVEISSIEEDYIRKGDWHIRFNVILDGNYYTPVVLETNQGKGDEFTVRELKIKLLSVVHEKNDYKVTISLCREKMVEE